MEKSGTAAGKISARLLILLCFIFAVSSAGAQSAELCFKTEEPYFFTTSDGVFELVIPNVRPDQVSFEPADFAENVSLVSLKKEAFVPDGTRVVLRLKFSAPGEYKIHSVKSRIKGRVVRIPFDSVTVYENPRLVQPKVYVSIDNASLANGSSENTFTAGKEIIFTVSVCHAVQVIQLSWNIPEDALFKEIKRYESTESVPRGTTFSTELVPAATYSWTPLVPGVQEIPSVIVTATSYAGSRVDVTFEKTLLTVLPPEDNDGETSYSEDAFAYAFSSSAEEKSAHSSHALSAEQVDCLVQLYTKERHSFPFISSAYRERKAFEKSVYLPVGKRVPSVPLFSFLLCAGILLFLLFVVFTVLRRKIVSIVCVSLAVVFLVCASVNGVYVNKTYAVFNGGTLSTIPEANKSSGISIQDGTKVFVAEQAGDWVFVQYEDISGWTEKDTVHFIR